MQPPERDAAIRWSRLPEAVPSAALRTRVLDAIALEPAASRTSLRAAAAAAVGIAAAFAFALGMAQRTPVSAPDRTTALLSMQGVEFVGPASAHGVPEVRAVVDGSAAARLGLQAGDRLTSLDRGAGGNMLNLAVAREGRTLYLALPVPRPSTLSPGLRRQSQLHPARDFVIPSPRSVVMQQPGGATALRHVPSLYSNPFVES